MIFQKEVSWKYQELSKDWLLKQGADVSAVDEDGHTSHGLARRRGCTAVETLLKRYAAQAAGAWGSDHRTAEFHKRRRQQRLAWCWPFNDVEMFS